MMNKPQKKKLGEWTKEEKASPQEFGIDINCHCVIISFIIIIVIIATYCTKSSFLKKRKGLIDPHQSTW